MRRRKQDPAATHFSTSKRHGLAAEHTSPAQLGAQPELGAGRDALGMKSQVQFGPQRAPAAGPVAPGASPPTIGRQVSWN